MSLGLHQSWFRCGSGLLSGRFGANSNLWRQLQRHHARVHESRLSWRRMRPGPSFGMVRDNFNVLGVTPVQPRRVRESRLSWACGCVLRPSRGVAWRIRRAGGNPGTTHVVCGNHACRGAWMRTAALSGATERVQRPGACSRAATLRESEDCACRGLDACCDPLGGCRAAPKQRTHLRCCHAPCEISRRTSGHGSCLSRETGLRPDASACLGRTPFGRCGETCASLGRCL